MRTVLCAPNAFKGCLSAPEAAAALAEGVRRAGALARELPLADGGDGTAEALVAALGGRWVELEVEDPLGRPAPARYGVLPDGRAVVELAAASGLARLDPAERDPLAAHTRGTGQLLRHALEAGHAVLLGVGGSATVDGGSGLLVALGARLLDAQGATLAPGGAALEQVAAVDLSAIPAAWRGRVTIACDVDSPLLGPAGAAAVFAPQKGARPEDVPRLERGLARWAQVLAQASPSALAPETPGAGAAGGVAVALCAALGATLAPGAAWVLEAAGFAQALEGVALCLTGEGQLDGQTPRGKAPWAVAQACRAAGVPVVAIGGDLGPGVEALSGPDGFAAVFSAQPGPSSLEDALDQAATRLEAVAEQVVRLFLAGGGAQ